LAQPTAPEENLLVIRVKNRDAGEVARLAEEILYRTSAPGDMDRGILTVDPGLNAIIVRAAGPGATWPASVKRIVAELDQPVEGGNLTLTLWRRGWAPDRPRSPEALDEARTVLGEQPGEKLDSFRIPVETGTYFSAWLEATGKPPVRVVGVVGPEDGKGRSGLRLLPLRVELVSPPPADGPPPMEEDKAPGPAAPEQSEPAPDEAGPTPLVSGGQPQSSTGLAAEPIGENPKTRPEEAAGPLLPPPIGEVVFAGPVTLHADQPTVIGPFSVPGVEGQLLVAVTVSAAGSGSR